MPSTPSADSSFSLGKKPILHKPHFNLPLSIVDPEFLRDNWQKFHVIWKNAVDPADFVSTTEIEQQLQASLLRWPYFTLLKDGRQPPTETYTTSRDVIGQQRPGYPDYSAISQAMAQGASLKLNQVGDWHASTRRIRSELEAGLPTAVSSYVFWTPESGRGMLPHRDAAHVLAIQLEGKKAWDLYASDDQIKSNAGLDVDTLEPTHSFVMEPGDVLYLPHGWPHVARAVDGPSMHLTFTMAEPTAADLTESLIDIFAARHPELVDGFHRLELTARAQAVLDAIALDAKTVSDDEWVETTLLRTRKEVG
ncbi:JmjC domain-containing protein [Rathayibacter tritici]|uniref:JmjC domain-containing protein n=1 Tax=Rathayibacter tritici TaxID=33888 RepID=UPI0009FC7917|nr:cupin domain-containing protein [Rathayibacter tritici]